MNDINKKYGVPNKMVSCPGCGLVYGHHNTKVDTISQECSTCVKAFKYPEVNLIKAEEFIKILLQ